MEQLPGEQAMKSRLVTYLEMTLNNPDKTKTWLPGSLTSINEAEATLKDYIHSLEKEVILSNEELSDFVERHRFQVTLSIDEQADKQFYYNVPVVEMNWKLVYTVSDYFGNRLRIDSTVSVGGIDRDGLFIYRDNVVKHLAAFRDYTITHADKI